MIDRSISGTIRRPAMHILRLLMDAAILYSVAIFIGIVCFCLESNGEIVMFYMVIPPLRPVVERY